MKISSVTTLASPVSLVPRGPLPTSRAVQLSRDQIPHAPPPAIVGRIHSAPFSCSSLEAPWVLVPGPCPAGTTCERAIRGTRTLVAPDLSSPLKTDARKPAVTRPVRARTSAECVSATISLYPYRLVVSCCSVRDPVNRSRCLAHTRLCFVISATYPADQRAFQQVLYRAWRPRTFAPRNALPALYASLPLPAPANCDSSGRSTLKLCAPSVAFTLLLMSTHAHLLLSLCEPPRRRREPRDPLTALVCRAFVFFA